MHYTLYIIALLAGACTSIQTGANTQLRLVLGHPVLAGMISFFTGTLVLILFAFLLRTQIPTVQQIQYSQWWMWTGGVLGAAYIISSILVAPHIGPASFFGLIITGQLITSVIVDHYGWLGFQVQPVNIQKILGVVLLVAGAFLIQASRN